MTLLTKMENRKQSKGKTCILPPITMQMEKKTERNLEFHTYIASNKKQRKAKPQSSGKHTNLHCFSRTKMQFEKQGKERRALIFVPIH